MNKKRERGDLTIKSVKKKVIMIKIVKILLGELFPKSIFKTYTQNNSTTGHHPDYIGGKGIDIFSVVLDISFRPISIKVFAFGIRSFIRHRSASKHSKTHLSLKFKAIFLLL